MEAKVTKKAIKEFTKKQLSSNSKWALNALVRIYAYQTEEEQRIEHTHDHNGVGFTGVDGEILTSFAKQYERRGFLTPKQMTILFKKMPKYWMQIVSISDRVMLNNLVANSLN